MIDHNSRDDKPFIIVALDTSPSVPQADIERWFEDWATQRKIGFKRLVGSWEGKEETSYILSADYENQLRHTWCKEQEAILYLTAKAGHYRQAWLHWRDGRTEAIGQWQACPASMAKQRSAWTRDPSTGIYYVAA